jgi:hypothetical protein
MYSAAAAGLASEAAGEEVETLAHRMADFTRWVLRMEEALGFERDLLKKALGASGNEGATTVLEAEPISRNVYLFARNFTPDEPWEGKSGELLDTLNDREGDALTKRSKDWPANGKVLSEKLAGIAPALQAVGVVWRRISQSNKGGRRYYLYFDESLVEAGDAHTEEGDAEGAECVPQENPIDKPKTAEWYAGDAGNARFPSHENDEDEGEV